MGLSDSDASFSRASTEPRIAFITPFAPDGSGGSLWSLQLETALARCAAVEVLRLQKPSRVPFFARLLRRARTYGFERASLTWPWLRRQIARGVGHFVIESTCLGWLAKDIRDMLPSARVVVVAQNVEAQYVGGRDDVHSWLRFALQTIVVHHERAAARFADHLIFLTDYDRRLFLRLYHPAASCSVVPLALRAQPRAPRTLEVRTPVPRLLFVGSDFFANRNALRALADTVPAQATVEILVAGKVAPPSRVPRQVRLLGFVDDIEGLYATCTAALSPVRVGGGMKVKIAEALSFGVPVIASRESARGYEAAVSSGVVRVFQNFAHLLALAEEWHRSPPNRAGVRRVFDMFYSA